MSPERRRRVRRATQRGVYLLPSLLTTGGLFMGFLSILFTFDAVAAGSPAEAGRLFVKAAWAIVGAGFFDALDGRIARASGTATRFGIEYDSLADLVSFGVAPALLFYHWALSSFGRLGWLAAFLYVACAALRLARFNTDQAERDPRLFVGLPAPGAGGMVCSTVLFFETHREFLASIRGPILGGVGMLLLAYVLDYLMISNIQYAKAIPAFLGRQPLNRVVSVILLLTLVVWQPEVGLFIFGVIYVTSGPLGIIPRARQRRAAREPQNARGERRKDDLGDSPPPAEGRANVRPLLPRR